MPELPEVETVKRSLEQSIINCKINSVILRRQGLRKPFVADLSAKLTNRRILSLRRIGKFIEMLFDDGSIVLFHLGMSGKIRLDLKNDNSWPEIQKHDHIILLFDTNLRFVFNDPRRFGMFEWLAGAAALQNHPTIKNLGPDPTNEGFEIATLMQCLAKTSAPIKQALLNQRIISGIGNIYACEALFRAKISPFVAAKQLAHDNSSSIEALHNTIIATLNDAIEAGGSTLKDYARPNEELGYFQHQFKVYGKGGEMCSSCYKSNIEQCKQAGRSTFYCPTCQVK